MSSQSIIEFESKKPNPELPFVYDVTPEEVLSKMSDVKLIDVRRHDEWVGELGHIAEAELITLNTLPANIEKLPKNQTIVFICRSGARSAQAAAFALENGVKSAYNMKGGMIAWNQKNYACVDKNGG